MKTLGSIAFGTSIIRADEYVLLAQVMKDNGSSIETIASDIEMLDDMLQLQKISSITNARRFTEKGRIRKDSHYLDVLNNRIDFLINKS